MMPDWPQLLLTSVLFEPLDATDAEIACFVDMKDNMRGGWGAGYTVIDGLLQSMQT
jgi:hypothetical protein